MTPIRFLRPALFALVSLLALPCVPGFADEKPSPPPVKAPIEPYAISVDFPGGPLSKLVTLLAAKDGSSLSIIQSEGLDPVLPPFSVREARVDSIVAALGRLLEPQGFNLIPVGPNVAVLARDTGRIPPPAFVALPMYERLAVWPVEQIVAAIQAGCEFVGAEGKPSTLRFKYHPGTKLLFVSGTSQEVEIARQIFVSLPTNNPGSASPPADKK